jgi:ferredoxin
MSGLSKQHASANKDICVACGACVKVCPKDAISIFKGCYAKVDTGKCIGCGNCSKECPAGCIVVKEREREAV